MEKSKLLDPSYKKERRKWEIKIFLYLLFLFTISCSFPKIIILDDPLSPEEHINLGVAYESKGQFELAIEEYNKASKKLPAAYLYLGNAYMKKGNLEEAEIYYKKTIKKQPDLADAYNNLAWLYYIKIKESKLTSNNILDEAERLSLEALRLDPLNENYRDTLSKILELKK